MINCDTFRASFGALLTGSVDSHERFVLLDHAERCAGCRDLYESRALLRSIIARSNGDERVPPLLDEALREARRKP